MIKTYKTNSQEQIIETTKIEQNGWINLTHPTEEEIKKINAATNIPESLIIKVLDYDELPRIEIEEEATLIVIDVPLIEDKKNKTKYTTVPLGIITTKDYFVTVSLKNTEVINDIITNKIKSIFTFKKTRFMIQILFRIASLYIKYLNIINKEIETKEKFLIKSTSNDELLHLMHIQKSLVYFTTSLKANEIILDKLAKGQILTLYEEDLDLLEDAIIENNQGIETANIYREIISSMSDTYATIISNNLNGIMKFLAGITIVLSIPTMIASFLGMNVPLGPLASYSFAFLGIISFAIIISVIIAFILRKKDML